MVSQNLDQYFGASSGRRQAANASSVGAKIVNGPFLTGFLLSQLLAKLTSGFKGTI